MNRRDLFRLALAPITARVAGLLVDEPSRSLVSPMIEPVRAVVVASPPWTRCPWTFRDHICNYRGPLDDCDKTVAACKERGNFERFGGLPGLPRIP